MSPSRISLLEPVWARFHLALFNNACLTSNLFARPIVLSINFKNSLCIHLLCTEWLSCVPTYSEEESLSMFLKFGPQFVKLFSPPFSLLPTTILLRFSRGRILGRKRVSPCYSPSPLQLCLEIYISSTSRNLFHICSNLHNFFRKVTVQVHCT
jgi:hypothetical protein